MNVNKNQTPIVIGIDHGYGNIKTASSCFRTNVKAYDTEPTFTSKAEFGSYTKLVSRAVNEFFERRLRIKDDPYFETREKEDAFIARVLDAVRHSAPSLPVSQETKAGEDENVEAMFAFLDDFG